MLLLIPSPSLVRTFHPMATPGSSHACHSIKITEQFGSQNSPRNHNWQVCQDLNRLTSWLVLATKSAVQQFCLQGLPASCCSLLASMEISEMLPNSSFFNTGLPQHLVPLASKRCPQHMKSSHFPMCYLNFQFSWPSRNYLCLVCRA